MLINVSHDKEFQKYLDRAEQRLHLKMVPILGMGIKLQVQKGSAFAQQYVNERGKPVLVAHYKRVFREMYSSIDRLESKDGAGVVSFLERMLGYIETEAAKRIVDISQSLGDYIRDRVHTGVQEGWGTDRIARDIQDDTLDISRSRAATIARTETHGAALWAMDESLDDKGIEVQTKTWWTASDNRVRESHAAMHGVTVNRDEAFSTDDGDCMYPGDDSLGLSADGIVNCRCSVLYNTESLSDNENL